LSGDQDIIFMRAAIEQAKKALEQGEVPVGAVLVKGDNIIARAHNSPITLRDPSAHAEILTLRQAAQKLKNYRLINTELYVTLEPCIMCCGALLHARVKKLVFGAYDSKTGAAGSVYDFTSQKELHHSVEVEGGILEEDCRHLLQTFFRKRRGQGQQP
jgi:tRNA(adenine34) deaminase